MICENEEKGVMVNTESYCSSLSASPLRIVIRFASQYPRTHASKTERPFAAHACGRMRSTATPLDCSRVEAGSPFFRILPGLRVLSLYRLTKRPVVLFSIPLLLLSVHVHGHVDTNSIYLGPIRSNPDPEFIPLIRAAQKALRVEPDYAAPP
ncbi:hypothetical protein C8J56DRAFT_897851 [Mycena floridula]|nr:hypothetical protein C8J56DRAFT_897851 [Mycena floridula]